MVIIAVLSAFGRSRPEWTAVTIMRKVGFYACCCGRTDCRMFLSGPVRTSYGKGALEHRLLIQIDVVTN